MNGTQKLECELTVKNGLVVYDLNGISRQDWRTLEPGYKAQGDNRWDGTINSTVRGRNKKRGEPMEKTIDVKC